MQVSTISGINRLPDPEKRLIYTHVLPPEILERYKLPPELTDPEGNDLLQLNCPSGSSMVEMSLFHQAGFPDPVFYGHITDTLNGQVHILLYVLNDPDSPRFDVDRLPDGTPTKLGAETRNLAAEAAALRAGLAPGQVRKGPHMLRSAVRCFEQFVESLGHEMYFAEPLYYHNAVLFERLGFNYEKGRKLMECIQEGFAPGSMLFKKLDGSTPFRIPGSANSIRLRSWAIHDGIMGEPFSEATMYKRVGIDAGLCTCDGCVW